MSSTSSLELTLLALKSYEFDDFVEEIDEILNCIKHRQTYDNAPTLTIDDLFSVLERMCNRQCSLKPSIFNNSLYDIIYNPASFDRLRLKVKSILVENI